MIATPNNLYLWSFFSHETNKMWRNFEQRGAKEKRRKKEAMKPKKGTKDKSTR